MPIVVPRLSTGRSSSTVSTSSTSASQDSVGNDSTTCPVNTRSRSKRCGLQGDLLHGEARCVICRNAWRIFIEHFVDEEASASSGQAQYFRTLPGGPTVQNLQEDQNYKGSLQKTHWQSSASSRKVWWLDNSISQSSQWRMWISKQSPIRSRGTRSSHSMDSILSVQNKKLPRKQNLVYVSSSSRQTSRKSFTLALPWSLAELVKSYPGIIERLRLPFRDKRYCWESGTQNYGRHLCCSVAIRLGRKVAGGFHGMILLSGKRSRPLIERENKLWKAIWRTIHLPVIPLELMIEYHPVSAKDRSRLHHHGKTVFTFVCALDMHCMRAGKGDSMVADMKELEKVGRDRNLCSRTQCNGSHHVEKLSKKQHIPDRRWNSQVVWNRSGFPKIHFNSGPPCTREHNDVRRIGRVSTIGQINGWQWSPKRFFGRSKGTTFCLHHFDPCWK